MGFISGSLYLMGGIMRGATRASMTTGNAIYSALQNARTKKDIKRIAQQAEESNLVSRAVIAMPYVNQGQLMLTSGDDNDVYRYDTTSATPALDYIWGESDDPESVIISGGQPLERVRALMPFVRKVQMAGVPIVVIHNGDDDVESMIDGNSVIQEKIGYDHADYDAFRGMPIEDIANLLYETMEDSTGASAEALLKSVLEVVVRKSGVLSFRSLALYQIDDLMDDLESMKTSGAISPDEYKSISRDYMSGSSEMDSVKAFLHKLNRQMDNIFGKKHTRSSNIKKTLNQKGVISFNIGKGSNDLAVSFILNHLHYFQEGRKQFAVVVDGVSISQFEQFSSLIRGITFAICQQDFISSIYGGNKKGEDMFTEIMGAVSVSVLLTHKSGTSCQKWSDQIGKYHKIKIRFSINQSNSFMMSNDSRGIQVDESDEPRVRPETISMLPPSLACIHRNSGTLFAQI